MQCVIVVFMIMLAFNNVFLLCLNVKVYEHPAMSDGAVLVSITSCIQPQPYSMLSEVFITDDIIFIQPGPEVIKCFFHAPLN